MLESKEEKKCSPWSNFCKIDLDCLKEIRSLIESRKNESLSSLQEEVEGLLEDREDALEKFLYEILSYPWLNYFEWYVKRIVKRSEILSSIVQNEFKCLGLKSTWYSITSILYNVLLKERQA